MLKLLKDLYAQKKSVCIYGNTEEADKFNYGYILSVNSDYIAVYMISPKGEFDGIDVRRVQDIFRIDTDNQYDEKMRKLCSLHTLPEFEYELDEEKIRESLLSVAVKTKKIVALETNGSGYNDIVGFVEEVSDELCKISVIDSYGYDDGNAFVRMDDITAISYASEDEEIVFALWKANHKD